MSTEIKIGCACGGYVEVSAGAGEYITSGVVERWEQEHAGHGGNALPVPVVGGLGHIELTETETGKVQ